MWWENQTLKRLQNRLINLEEEVDRLRSLTANHVHKPLQNASGDWTLKKNSSLYLSWFDISIFTLTREHICSECHCRYVETKDVDRDVAPFLKVDEKEKPTISFANTKVKLNRRKAKR